MLETAVLAVGMGTWVTLGLIGVFALVGLIALAVSKDTDTEIPGGVRYIFGLGKHPRLLNVPGNRDIPATPEPLGGQGLRSLAADAQAKTPFKVDIYELPDGRTAPYELSEDIPDGIHAIELEHEDVRVRVDAEGGLTSSRRLTPTEIDHLATLLQGILGESALRADRRTWAPATEHTPGQANRQRA